MKVNRFNLEGKPQGEVEVSDALLITNRRGTQAVSDTVVAYLANQRQGTAKAKRRGEVSGGGKKPWKQKGTGRARAGSIRSPLWRHGGVVFGPHPRDYSLKVTKKVKALAFKKALSERLAAGDAIIVDEVKIPSGKTKDFIRVLKNLKLKGKTLFINSGNDEMLQRASRNVESVFVTRPEFLNPFQLLQFDHLLFTAAAFEIVTKRLGVEAAK